MYSIKKMASKHSLRTSPCNLTLSDQRTSLKTKENKELQTSPLQQQTFCHKGCVLRNIFVTLQKQKGKKTFKHRDLLYNASQKLVEKKKTNLIKFGVFLLNSRHAIGSPLP